MEQKRRMQWFCDHCRTTGIVPLDNFQNTIIDHHRLVSGDCRASVESLGYFNPDLKPEFPGSEHVPNIVKDTYINVGAMKKQ